MVLRLVYSSVNSDMGVNDSKLQRLRDILASAQKHNGQNNVTGFLVFDGTTFLQILEGERKDVIGTYDRIKLDKRHKDIHLLEMTDVPQRQFAEWHMGGSMRTIEAQEIYLSHGISQEINLKMLTAAKIVALALDLQAYEQQQSRERV